MKNKLFILLFTIASTNAFSQEELPQHSDENAVEKTPWLEEGEFVYEVTEEPAQYPGGTTELYTFLSKNFKYPQSLVEEGKEGKIYLEFVILKSGYVAWNSIRVRKSASKELNEEAFRVIHLMPKWEPGKQNGVPVNSRYVIPLVFKF